MLFSIVLTQFIEISIITKNKYSTSHRFVGVTVSFTHHPMNHHNHSRNKTHTSKTLIRHDLVNLYLQNGQLTALFFLYTTPQHNLPTNHMAQEVRTSILVTLVTSCVKHSCKIPLQSTNAINYFLKYYLYQI